MPFCAGGRNTEAWLTVELRGGTVAKAQLKKKAQSKKSSVAQVVELGDRVKSRLYGVTGIASGQHDFHGGMRQYSVTIAKAPRDDRGRLLDVDDLVIIKKRAIKPTSIVDSTLRIGDRASDGPSKFVGIITTRSAYIYGCLQFTLTAENGEPRSKEENLNRSFDAARLSLVNAGAVPSAGKQQALPHGGPEAQLPSVCR